MATHDVGELMQALIAKLYETITGDDEAITIPRNKFVSWFLPGIPFTPEDFTYAAKGFTTKDAYVKAFGLSMLFDYVPDISVGFVTDQMQQTVYAGTQDKISTIYNDVLRYSRVVHHEPSEEEKKKLQDFRNKLVSEVEVKDILTDEIKIESRPSPLTVAYTEKMNEYITAADELIALKIDAMAASGDDEESMRRVHAYNQRAPILRKKVEAAEMAWVAQGYKKEYELMNAYIEQVTERSMVLYKQDLKRKFDRSLMTSADTGDFMYSTVVPGTFATSPGWTEFSFNEHDYETHKNKKTNKWGGEAGVNLGFWSGEGKAGGSKEQQVADQSLEDFEAKFRFTQVPIVRPWFEPGFFSMRSWTLDKNWDLNYDGKPISDGADPPTGRLVAYPVSALFVKGVEFHAKDLAKHDEIRKSTSEGGGKIRIGPFGGGGTYAKGNEEETTKEKVEEGWLKIDGMALFGFINSVFRKCPDPNPDIDPNDFVGGDEEK